MTALSIRLEGFEGPLELLWHLIERDQLDIHDIPIAHITEQYLQHLQEQEWRDLEAAGEFLVMAAQLLQLKLRVLLPRPDTPTGAGDEVDPRQELVDRLLTYRSYRAAAAALQSMALQRSRQWERPNGLPVVVPVAPLGTDAAGLRDALAGLLARATPLYSTITRDLVSIGTAMRELVSAVFRARRQGRKAVSLSELVGRSGRRQWVISFLALLELVRRGRVLVAQERPLGEIYIRPRQRAEEVPAS
ncbi:MAG: segregation/condensation protein A [Bacillota bacterium]